VKLFERAKSLEGVSMNGKIELLEEGNEESKYKLVMSE
jgi:hypothetical protein